MDEVLADFRLPVFYEVYFLRLEIMSTLTFKKDPRPHATIAWALNDITPSLPRIVGPLPEKCKMDVNKIICKIGKWMYIYDLK